MASQSFFISFYFKSTKIDNRNLKWGKYNYEIKVFFSNTCWTQLLVPLKILRSKISLKYIPIHIYNFEHSRVIMNMKLSSHGFLFHRNINRRENKAQIPLIIITMRKKQEYISDVQQKIIEIHLISEVTLRKELKQ